ncbi:hypothetical protein B0H19DRAFT_1069403 [Mycena capillaripes]|nr:hypothetical protein B0H19DRAFT_1069403 [Mycena capillaripes]
MAFITIDPEVPRVRLPTTPPNPFPALPRATTNPAPSAKYDTIRTDQREGIKFWIPAPKPKVPPAVGKEQVPLGTGKDKIQLGAGNGTKMPGASGKKDDSNVNGIRKEKKIAKVPAIRNEDSAAQGVVDGKKKKPTLKASGREEPARVPEQKASGKRKPGASSEEIPESRKGFLKAAVEGSTKEDIQKLADWLRVKGWIPPKKEVAEEQIQNRKVHFEEDRPREIRAPADKPKGIIKKKSEVKPTKTIREPNAQKTAQVPARPKTGSRFTPLSVEEEEAILFPEGEFPERTPRTPEPRAVNQKGNHDRQEAIKTIKRVVGQSKVPTPQVVELAEALSKFEEAENPAVNRATKKANGKARKGSKEKRSEGTAQGKERENKTNGKPDREFDLKTLCVDTYTHKSMQELADKIRVQQGKPGTWRKGAFRCFNCGWIGHILKRCRRNQKRRFPVEEFEIKHYSNEDMTILCRKLRAGGFYKTEPDTVKKPVTPKEISKPKALNYIFGKYTVLANTDQENEKTEDQSGIDPEKESTLRGGWLNIPRKGMFIGCRSKKATGTKENSRFQTGETKGEKRPEDRTGDKEADNNEKGPQGDGSIPSVKDTEEEAPEAIKEERSPETEDRSRIDPGTEPKATITPEEPKETLEVRVPRAGRTVKDVFQNRKIKTCRMYASQRNQVKSRRRLAFISEEPEIEEEKAIMSQIKEKEDLERLKEALDKMLIVDTEEIPGESKNEEVVPEIRETSGEQGDGIIEAVVKTIKDNKEFIEDKDEFKEERDRIRKRLEEIETEMLEEASNSEEDQSGTNPEEDSISMIEEGNTESGNPLEGVSIEEARSILEEIQRAQLKKELEQLEAENFASEEDDEMESEGSIAGEFAIRSKTQDDQESWFADVLATTADIEEDLDSVQNDTNTEIEGNTNAEENVFDGVSLEETREILDKLRRYQQEETLNISERYEESEDSGRSIAGEYAIRSTGQDAEGSEADYYEDPEERQMIAIEEIVIPEDEFLHRRQKKPEREQKSQYGRTYTVHQKEKQILNRIESEPVKEAPKVTILQRPKGSHMTGAIDFRSQEQISMSRTFIPERTASAEARKKRENEEAQVAYFAKIMATFVTEKDPDDFDSESESGDEEDLIIPDSWRNTPWN